MRLQRKLRCSPSSCARESRELALRCLLFPRCPLRTAEVGATPECCLCSNLIAAFARFFLLPGVFKVTRHASAFVFRDWPTGRGSSRLTETNHYGVLNAPPRRDNFFGNVVPCSSHVLCTHARHEDGFPSTPDNYWLLR